MGISKGQDMRYANSKRNHQGIGVEVNPSAGLIEIKGIKSRESIAIMDVEQLAQVLDLLIDGGEILGWPVFATIQENIRKQEGHAVPNALTSG